MSVRSDNRGQSGTLALAVVLVLAFTSALLITGIGSVTLEEGRQVAETQSGVRTMTEFDSRASLVALEGGDATTIDVNLRTGDGRVTVDRRGEIRFVLRNTSSNVTAWERNVTLGTVTYENGGEHIAYQGGGVWRGQADGNGSVMVSPPEVHYRQGTLTLPMINVTGPDQRVSNAHIRKVSEERIYPNRSRGKNGSNPVVEGNELVMYVQSDYYRAWGEYFERRIGGNVTVFPATQTVRVNLVAPEERFAVDSGLISVGTGAPIDMRGNAGDPTFVDSYNSWAGNYSNTSSGNGTVRSPSGLDLGGESFVRGDVNTGGTLGFSGNNNTIYGNAFHQGISKPQNGDITGINETNGSGVRIPPIDGTVNQRVNSICDSGEPMPEPATTINATGETSDYCYDNKSALRIKNENLTIDVSDGDVDLAVDGDLILKNDGRIKVEGTEGTNHTARLWLAGDEVEVTSSEITVPDEEAPAFRLFAKSGTSISLQGQGGPSSSFVGLLYAPSQQGAGGGLSMRSGSDLYGSAVVGNVEMKSGSAVHYDQALGGFTFDRQGTPASRLSYLYVTIHEIEVEDR